MRSGASAPQQFHHERVMRGLLEDVVGQVGCWRRKVFASRSKRAGGKDPANEAGTTLMRLALEFRVGRAIDLSHSATQLAAISTGRGGTGVTDKRRDYMGLSP